jgi:PiT family inorganic phosphate transporter
MVGAILGMGLCIAPQDVNWSSLIEIVICWIGTPIGAALIALILYPTLGWVLDRLPINLVTRSIFLKFALLISGSYGAYALGANNVANATGVFYKTAMFRDVPHAGMILTLIGGVSIAVGVLTYSKNVMFTVGSDLVQLGAFSAWISVLSAAITVHIYAMVGVPISTTQAIIGAVLGIGIARGIKTINRATLLKILSGWVATPLIAGGLCYGMAWLTNLRAR